MGYLMLLWGYLVSGLGVPKITGLWGAGGGLYTSISCCSMLGVLRDSFVAVYDHKRMGCR